MSDHGQCFNCGAAAGSNTNCPVCGSWARIMELAARNRKGGSATGQNGKRKKYRPAAARRPQRQPSPVVEVGDAQLPASDR